MRGVQRRVGRPETTSRKSGGPPLVVIAFEDGDGLLRDALTKAPLVPPWECG